MVQVLSTKYPVLIRTYSPASLMLSESEGWTISVSTSVSTLSLPWHGQGEDPDQLRGAVADDGPAKDHPGSRVAYHLDESAGLALEHAAGVGGKRDLGDADLAPLRGRLSLLQPDRGDLRFGEHRLRHLGVIDRGHLVAEGVAGDLPSLHRRHRRERDLPGDVAGGVDVGSRGALELVDDDVPAVGLHLRLLQSDPVAERNRPDGQQNVRPLHPPSVVALHQYPVVLPRCAGGTGADQQPDASLQEVLLEHGGHLGIGRVEAPAGARPPATPPSRGWQRCGRTRPR